MTYRVPRLFSFPARTQILASGFVQASQFPTSLVRLPFKMPLGDHGDVVLAPSATLPDNDSTGA